MTLLPACDTCGREEKHSAPRATVQTELEQLLFQEQTLVRLLTKCRSEIEAKKQMLDILP
jgi:hypothetical protein